MRFIAVPSDDFDHTLVDCGTVIHCYTIVIQLLLQPSFMPPPPP